MDKIASKSINTALLIQKRVAILCLVGNIYFCVASQLVGAMGKLTLISIRAQPSLGKVFAERTFDFVIWGGFKLERVFKTLVFAKVHDFIFSLCGDIGAGLVNGGKVLINLYLGCHVALDFKRELIIILNN